MRSTNEILRAVIGPHGLREPDGRALYAYDAQPADLQDLEVALRERCNRTTQFDRLDGAAFCLHAAYAFCESHIDGAWAWSTVTGPIRFDAPHATLASLTERGLGWWRRRVLPVGDRRQFLATLACEGGAPSRAHRARGCPPPALSRAHPS